MESNYFWMSTSDWAKETYEMSASEKGVYITLVCMVCETERPIKRDDERLSRICGCRSKSAFTKTLDWLIKEGKVNCNHGYLTIIMEERE